MNATILAAIAVWRERHAICAEKFNVYVTGARTLIEGTGGTYVTSSPDEKGYCQDYELNEGVEYLLEGVTSGIPQHPDIGNRIRVLELAYLETAYAMNDARKHVVGLVRAAAGDTADARVTDDALFAAVIALTTEPSP